MRARPSEDRGRSSALHQLQQSAQSTDGSWKRGPLHSMRVSVATAATTSSINRHSWRRGPLHSMRVSRRCCRGVCCSILLQLLQQSYRGSIRASVSEDGGRSSEHDRADSKHQARSLARTILRDAIGEDGRHERLRKDAVDGFKRLCGSLRSLRY